MPNRIDLTGKRFGRLTVIEYAGKSKWLCKCDCGTVKAMNGEGLRKKAFNRAAVCAKKDTRLSTEILTQGYTSDIRECCRSVIIQIMSDGKTTAVEESMFVKNGPTIMKHSSLGR